MPFQISTTPAGRLLLIAAFAVVAMLPMYFYGVTGGNDQAQHFQFAWTVSESIRSGEIYPSVAGDTNRGFGDVGLRFYPPLTYYVLALAYAVIGDWFYASLLSFTLAFFFGGIGIYLWACEEFDQQTALIAAAMYTLAPFHLNLIYTNGLMAEFFAEAILPFCFLYLTRVCRGGRWLDVLGFAIACSLLMLTHLPLTIIGSIGMAVYALVLINKRTAWPAIGKCLVSAVLAVAMTAFYWARMLPELPWVKHSSQKYFETTWSYTANYLLYPSHFTRFGEDAQNLWLGDMMLLATLLIALPSAVWVISNRASITRFVAAVIVVILFSVFMTTPLSSFIWDNFSSLQKVQFPWRWLSIVTAFTAVFAAVGIKRAGDVINRKGSYAVAVGLGAVLVVFVFMAAFIVKGSTYTPRAELNEQVAHVPVSTGCECWFPIWAEWSALGQTEQVKVDGRTAIVTDWAAEYKTFEIGPGEASSASVATFYYPHWHARVNGSEIQVDKTDDGRILLPIPAEPAHVDLAFREPGYVKAAYTTSILSWGVVICLSAALLFNNRRRLAASL